MNRALAGILLCALMGAGVAHGQCGDPFDATLCVYELDATQQQQFSTTDGQVSAFWDEWSGRDYVELLPPGDCYPDKCNFTDESDASMTVKLAATTKGLYLYAGVQDNVWVDWTDPTRHGDDSVDLYFDAMSADEIWNCTDCLVGLYDSKLTFTTQQFQVFMGGNTTPTTFRFASYDNALWSWTLQDDLTFADAKNTYGFDIEVVQVDATHKVQEWFVPWTSFGNGGVTAGTALANKLFAFAGGYNDMDGDLTEPQCLRWPNGKDPWIGDQNYWGDMLLPADIGVVEPMAVHPSRHAARPYGSSKLLRAECYTLRGRKLPAHAAGRATAAGMTVRRLLRSDGSAVASVVPPGR
jgi:hypothetical protein